MFDPDRVARPRVRRGPVLYTGRRRPNLVAAFLAGAVGSAAIQGSMAAYGGISRGDPLLFSRRFASLLLGRGAAGLPGGWLVGGALHVAVHIAAAVGFQVLVSRVVLVNRAFTAGLATAMGFAATYGLLLPRLRRELGRGVSRWAVATAHVPFAGLLALAAGRSAVGGR